MYRSKRSCYQIACRKILSRTALRLPCIEYMLVHASVEPASVLVLGLQPAMGAVVSFTLSRTVMKRPNPPYRLLIRVGAFINTLSVISLPWVAQLPLQTLRPVLVAQLLFWAFGQFVSNLPANAIVRTNLSVACLLEHAY